MSQGYSNSAVMEGMEQMSGQSKRFYLKILLSWEEAESHLPLFYVPPHNQQYGAGEVLGNGGKRWKSALRKLI